MPVPQQVTRRAVELPQVTKIGRYGLLEPSEDVAEPETLQGDEIAFGWPGAYQAIERATGKVYRYQLGKKESSFVTDEGDFRRALDIARSARDAGWLIWEAEYEQIEKFGALSSVSPGWANVTEPLTGRTPELSSAELDLLYSKVCGYVLDESKPVATSKYRYRKNTNHGSPTWNNSNDDLLFHIRLGLMFRSRRMTFDDCRAYLAKLGVPVDLGTVATLFRRAGPNRKPVTTWNMFTGTPDFTTKGLYCRSRHVYGLPTWMNVLMRPLASEAKSLMYGLPRHFHQRPETIAAMRGSSYMLSDDISGFDLSVSFEHQKRLAKYMYVPMMKRVDPNAGYWKDIYEQLQTGVYIIAPPSQGMRLSVQTDRTAFYPSTTGRIVPRHGITASGSVLTITDGSFINLTRMVYAMCRSVPKWRDMSLSHAIDSVLDSFKSRDVEAYLQGDDVLMAGEVFRSLSEERWVEASEQFGFGTTISSDPIFLMQAIDRKRRYSYRLTSRFLQNMFFRERPKSGEFIERLSFATNLSQVVLHPHGRTMLNYLDPLIKERFAGLGWVQLIDALQSGILAQQAQKEGGAASFMNWLLSVTHGEIDDATRPEILSLLGGRATTFNDVKSFLTANTVEVAHSQERELARTDVAYFQRHIDQMWEQPVPNNPQEKEDETGLF
uniref:RNA-directed RNA polymerase n=1 Tax=viral metagenome TaxID=1070528 RepID=A0A2V0RJ16_9ZZZZ